MLTNPVDVINVLSVVQPAKVSQWIEVDDEIPVALYWREAFDCTTSQMTVCINNSPTRKKFY